MSHMTLQEVVHLCGGKQLEGGGKIAVSHVTFDSRLVERGSLFFALKGEKVDGHDFLSEVYLRGGVGAVVESSYRGPDYGLPLISVDQVVEALHRLAKWKQQQRFSYVIGVTGTVGKSMVKEFIATLLEGDFSVAKTRGNMNSQVGLPIFLLNEVEDEEVTVLEMGMSLPGEIARLVKLAPPKMGILTHLSLVHGAHFNRIEEIFEEKCQLFRHQGMQMGCVHHSTLFHPCVSQLPCAKMSYGGNGEYRWMREGGQIYVMERGVKSPPFSLPFTASHLIDNFLGSVAVARYMGCHWSDLVHRAKGVHPPPHRFTRKEREGIIYIDDTYNASPASMKAALSNLPSVIPSDRGGNRGDNKRIGVFGPMGELGDFSENSHIEIAQFALFYLDYLLCVGEECKPMVRCFQEKKPAELFMSLDDLYQRLKQLAVPGDVILVKGSHVYSMWNIFRAC